MPSHARPLTRRGARSPTSPIGKSDTMQLQSSREFLKRRPNRELTQLFDRIQQTPAANTYKGMYLTGLVSALNDAGVDYVHPERVQSFKDYSLRAYMELLLDSAVTLYPHDSTRDGLRRLGQL